jgi:hypothetical protein
MARQRAEQPVSFFGRVAGAIRGLINPFLGRARRQSRTPLPCEYWFFRWEWTSANGGVIITGVHSTFTPAGWRPVDAARRARAELRRDTGGSLAAVMARYPGGRLVLHAIDDPLPVSGPC